MEKRKMMTVLANTLVQNNKWPEMLAKASYEIAHFQLSHPNSWYNKNLSNKDRRLNAYSGLGDLAGLHDYLAQMMVDRFIWVEDAWVEDAWVEDARVEDARVEDAWVEDAQVEDTCVKGPWVKTGWVKAGRVKTGWVKVGRVEGDRVIGGCYKEGVWEECFWVKGACVRQKVLKILTSIFEVDFSKIATYFENKSVSDSLESGKFSERERYVMLFYTSIVSAFYETF